MSRTKSIIAVLSNYTMVGGRLGQGWQPFAVVGMALLMLFASSCQRRVTVASYRVQLAAGETVQGQLTQMDKKGATFKLADGSYRLVPLADLTSLHLMHTTQRPSNDKADYSSPTATFNSFTTALRAGDLKAMAACYVSETGQAMFKKLSSYSTVDRDKMKRDGRDTVFSIRELQLQEDEARMVVSRLHASGVYDTDVIFFKRQQRNWKIVPE